MKAISVEERGIDYRLSDEKAIGASALCMGTRILGAARSCLKTIKRCGVLFALLAAMVIFIAQLTGHTYAAAIGATTSLLFIAISDESPVEKKGGIK